MWFMPALFSLTLLRSAIAATPQPTRAMLGVAVIGAHFVLRYAPMVLPLNPLPALYVLPLGWAFAVLAQRPQAKWVWLGLALVGAVVAGVLHDHINLASLQVADWQRPDLVLLHDGYAIAATLAVVQFGPVLAKVRPFVALGEHSLVVFLSHQFVLKAVDVVVVRHPSHSEQSFQLAVAAVAVPVALTVGWVLALVLARPTLRRWVLPNGVSDWAVTALLRRAPQPG